VTPPGSAAPKVNQTVRRARTLDGLGKLEAAFVERLKQQLQPALDKLGHKEFPLGRIEIQVTASNDGDYFRLHQDTGPEDTREVSFVYFFHREPRRFSGGELRIYPTRVVDGRLTPADHAHTLSPRQDTIVFFPSKNEHEVLPVRVPSKAFADSRFTVNGWIHRQK
jgi:Rps23 Pro-64 3,4-dihydroxylase Tpa1-like proline 4-hydroxylase